MRSAVTGLVALALLPLVAAGAPANGVLEPLVSAIADAEGHAASLAEYAATAPPPSLTILTEDEQAAFSAVTAASQALDQIMHHSPAVLRRDTDVALLAELNRVHDALGAYAQARTAGDRRTMRAAASDAVAALQRADALLDPAKSYGIFHPAGP